MATETYAASRGLGKDLNTIAKAAALAKQKAEAADRRALEREATGRSGAALRARAQSYYAQQNELMTEYESVRARVGEKAYGQALRDAPKNYFSGATSQTEQSAYPVSESARLAGAVAQAKTGSPTGFVRGVGEVPTSTTPGPYQPTPEDLRLAVKKGTLYYTDPITGEPYRNVGNNQFVSVRTKAQTNAAKNKEAMRLAESGEANYQDLGGTPLKITYESSDKLNETLLGLEQINKEGKGKEKASFNFVDSEFLPAKTPFFDPLKKSLTEARSRSLSESQEYFDVGGSYVIPGSLLKTGAFSLGIAKGAIQESQNTGAVLKNIAVGGLFGGGERALKLGSRSENALLRTSAKGSLKVLPIVNFALAGGYALERGYHGAQAFDEKRLGEFVGETAVQIGTFGLGYGTGKVLVSPRQLSISGRPTSEINIQGFGEQRYEGRGQEVNAPIEPKLVRTTSYTEKADGYLGLFGKVNTKIVEFDNTRIIRRDIGGTPEKPTYRFVSIVKDTSPSVAGGVPLENVFVFRRGKLVKTYSQTAEGFGRFVTSSTYNVNRERSVTNTALSTDAQKPIRESTTVRFRKIDKPDKSVVGQTAAEERILTFRNQVSPDYLIVGKVGVGARAEAISFTRPAELAVEGTLIDRTLYGSKALKPKKLFTGKSKVNLDVVDTPLRNEFTQSVNRIYKEGPADIQLSDKGDVVSATQTYGSYAGSIEKPFIETLGAKRVTIAGTLNVIPTRNSQKNFFGSSSPIKVTFLRMKNKLDIPRLLGEELGVSAARLESNFKLQRNRQKLIEGSSQVLATSGDVVNGVSLEQKSFVSSLDIGIPSATFSVPIPSSKGILSVKPFSVYSSGNRSLPISVPSQVSVSKLVPVLSSIPTTQLSNRSLSSNISSSLTNLSRSQINQSSISRSVSQTATQVQQTAVATTTTTTSTRSFFPRTPNLNFTIPPPILPYSFDFPRKKIGKKSLRKTTPFLRDFAYTPTVLGLGVPTIRSPRSRFSSGIEVRPVVVPRGGFRL